MRSSRERVMELIRRWQSENCLIRFSFILKDHVLEISYSHCLNAMASPLDDNSFLLMDMTEPDRQLNVKLSTDYTYDVTDVQKEAHPTFIVRVEWKTLVQIHFGDLGTLVLYEPEPRDERKIM